MELNTLKPAPGSKRARKRVCRGIGSGTGKTGGRGHKGQRARSGGFHKVGFEGGQMPLQRRLPKRGFNSPTREDTAEVRLKVALAGIAVSKGARAAIEAAGGSTDAPIPQPKPKPEPKWVAAPQPEAQAKPGKDEAKAKAKADKSEAKAKGEAKKAEARPDAKPEGKKGKKGE